jgi:hypothetical protein
VDLSIFLTIGFTTAAALGIVLVAATSRKKPK